MKKKRPHLERAYACKTYLCSNQDCGGVHILPERESGEPICELVIPIEALQTMLALFVTKGHV